MYHSFLIHSSADGHLGYKIYHTSILRIPQKIVSSCLLSSFWNYFTSFHLFIATLFIIARTWKQPRCPSGSEWIRKLWYIYTVEYYSAVKKNTFESVLMRWMKLEPIIQSEVSQKEKHQYCILMHIYGI